MGGLRVLLLTIVTGIALTAIAPSAGAQVSVEIGAAPDCPYGYYDVPPYACAPAGYYGPEWFNDGSSLALAPGFMDPVNFAGTSTIISIQSTATRAQCQNGARGLSRPSVSTLRTSKEMKCVTVAATQSGRNAS